MVQSGGSQQQLPFVVFGLGETPNFIEDLTIGAGYSRGGNDSTVALGYHQWSLLVPNSQVIVITTPPNMASKWRVELYLTPSQLVYSTAAVLCGIAIATAVIAALLQAREKVSERILPSKCSSLPPSLSIKTPKRRSKLNIGFISMPCDLPIITFIITPMLQWVRHRGCGQLRAAANSSWN